MGGALARARLWWAPRCLTHLPHFSYTLRARAQDEALDAANPHLTRADRAEVEDLIAADLKLGGVKGGVAGLTCVAQWSAPPRPNAPQASCSPLSPLAALTSLCSYCSQVGL